LDFRHGRDAWIELRLPKGSTFTLTGEFLEAGELSVLTDNAIFLRLMKTRLASEGKRLENFSAAQVKKRFFIDSNTFKRSQLITTISPRATIE
ncbi:MAG: hypothetical protein HY584_06580, partial [Candidatus Omnitrophica bacterium]|nr:hypothetical protein [Candidatus Omnitrophota bacterium]